MIIGRKGSAHQIQQFRIQRSPSQQVISKYLRRITKDMRKLFQLIRQSLRETNYDYTTGSIRTAIVMLAIPMMLEMCLESVFAVVDIYFVNQLNNDAVSVVGLTEAVITIVYSLAIGLSAAATAIVARRIGEKDPLGAAKAAKQALLVSLIIITCISIIGFIFSAEILQMMGASQQAISQGVIYTQIMMASSGVIVLLFLINGIFRGAGNAAVAMKSLWMANACNIVLCPILILGIGDWDGLGIAGAAIATCTGRGIGVIYQCKQLFSRSKNPLPMFTASWALDRTIIRSLLSISVPATLQFIVQSASWIVLTRLVAQWGTDASAGYQTAFRLLLFFLLPAWGISNAAATLVGQNLGANQPERAAKSVVAIAKYNACMMGLMLLISVLGAEWLISLFIHDPMNPSYAYAVDALRIVSTGNVLYGISMVLMQAFNGSGDSKTPTIISLFGFWLFQIPLAYVLSLYFGIHGIYWAIPIAECIMTALYAYYFVKGKWKTQVV
jgi:putative MATE family efflux protein